MPYVFGILAVLNVAIFGFFWFNPVTGGTYEQVKSTIQKPVNYQNNSRDIPPVIGDKK